MKDERGRKGKNVCFLEYVTSVQIENGKEPCMFFAARNIDFFFEGEILLNAVLNRDPDRPLITVANHHSCKIILIFLYYLSDEYFQIGMDDPLLFGI